MRPSVVLMEEAGGLLAEASTLLDRYADADFDGERFHGNWAMSLLETVEGAGLLARCYGSVHNPDDVQNRIVFTVLCALACIEEIDIDDYPAFEPLTVRAARLGDELAGH